MSSGYTDDFGPNVARILAQASIVVRGRIPAQVRKELQAAVKAGVLGRLPKDGLKPEIFYHPDHRNGAKTRQQVEAAYAVSCIATVIASPADVRDGLERNGIDPLDYARSERWKVNRAVAAGRLVKKPCAVCGSPRSQAHHQDYSRPLDVIWLCAKHHAEEHAKATGAL